MSLVQGLFRDYGDFVIDIPKWEILDQGTTVLWGPSGSGKTSLLRILMGFDAQAKADWVWNDTQMTALMPGDRRLGVVMQGSELFPHMTARENILFATEARKISSDDAEARLAKLASELRIANVLDRAAGVLSGGERQRVALARAVAARPRLLILDEPFSAVDADNRAEARQLVHKLIASENVPVILVTHDESDFSGLNGKISEMRNGKIVAERRFP